MNVHLQSCSDCSGVPAMIRFVLEHESSAVAINIILTEAPIEPAAVFVHTAVAAVRGELRGAVNS